MIRCTLLLGLLVGVLNLDNRVMSEDLKVGADAPEFSLPGTDGKTYKLSQFKDKKYVVVAWYPKALTGG